MFEKLILYFFLILLFFFFFKLEAIIRLNLKTKKKINKVVNLTAGWLK